MNEAHQSNGISQAIGTAFQHHQAGHLQQAEVLYRQVLLDAPNHPDALHLLGMLVYQAGNSEAAVELVSQAIRSNPTNHHFHNNLGAIYADLNSLDDAVACYRKALAIKPDFVDAHTNLGGVFTNQGKHAEAVACYQSAVALQPEIAEAHFNLGCALADQGRLEESVTCYRQTLALQPDFAQAHNNLGNALKSQGKLADAVFCFEAAIALKPDFAEAHCNLGGLLTDLGKPDEAIVCIQRALALRPDFAIAHNNLGNALSARGDHDEAVACYHKTIELQPDYVEAHCNLGNALRAIGKADEAAACYQRALALNSGYAKGHNDLGIAYDKQGKFDEAIDCFQRALVLAPDYAEAQCCLGNVFKNQGKLDEAIACYRSASRMNPGLVEACSNLLFALQYEPSHLPSELLAEHRRFSALFETPLQPLRRPHRNTLDAGRRLKVGYVSADFNKHSVAYFIEPVLANHDESQISVFCYYNNNRRDDFTERISGLAEHWVPCLGMTDEQLDERIRSDGIDILVDLSGHTGGNRLLVFARKPAPVQAMWLGYPGTTGLQQMDYWITDPLASPAGTTEQHHSEELIRLPHALLCYRPSQEAPEVTTTPAVANGYVTFGSFNNISKISDPVVLAWCKILLRVPKSRLLLKSFALGDATIQARMKARFAMHGIEDKQLILLGHEANTASHLDKYHDVDIALDTFPYCGVTTSCEALWMGVPLITLAGNACVSRMGVTIASNVGHPEWVARDENEYVRKACELATDLEKLKTLRLNLRDEVRNSALTDAAGFTLNLEATYRKMWHTWCASQPVH